jgi:hypothetical protein
VTMHSHLSRTQGAGSIFLRKSAEGITAAVSTVRRDEMRRRGKEEPKIRSMFTGLNRAVPELISVYQDTYIGNESTLFLLPNLPDHSNNIDINHYPAKTVRLTPGLDRMDFVYRPATIPS